MTKDELIKLVTVLQAELDATNRQVEILSDALAESRREVAPKDEALDLALEALEKSLPRLAPYGEQDWLDSRAAITAIKQALKQPVQPMESLLAAIQAEPVTLIHKWRVLELVKEHAAQPAVPLTKKELRKMHHEDQFGLFCDFDEFEQIVRATEQSHGITEKGQP